MESIATPRAPGLDAQSVLEQAALPAPAVAAWLASRPDLSGDYRLDAAASSHFWLGGADLLGKLPPKPKRDAAEAAAAGAILATTRVARDRFLAAHVETLYRTLTRDYRSFIRVEQLAYDAAALA